MEEMSTTSIIVGIIGALGGLAGLAAFIRQLVMLRTDKNAGAIANGSNVIQSLKSAIDGFEAVVEDLKRERNEAKQEAHVFREERDAYRDACITAENGFCTNYGCPLRNPPRGTARQWMKENAGTDALQGNFKTLAELMDDKNIRY